MQNKFAGRHFSEYNCNERRLSYAGDLLAPFKENIKFGISKLFCHIYLK